MTASLGSLPPGTPDLRRLAAERLSAGDRAGGADALARYLDAPPRDRRIVDAIAALGRGDVARAGAAIGAAIAADPRDPLALLWSARVLLRGEQPARAEPVFRRLLALVPGHRGLAHDLALALFFQGRAEDVAALADPLLAADPDLDDLRAVRARARSALGEHDGALDDFAALAAARPADRAARFGLGHALRALGRRDEAIAAFRAATTLSPGYGEAWWALANLKVGTLTDADAGTLADALADPATSEEDRVQLRFALARRHEEAGRIGAAWDEYVRANAARLATAPKGAPPSPGVLARAVRATVTPTLLAARADAGAPSDAPIFVVGMPRSGSTLVEQILASHPLVEGTRELPDIPRLAAAIPGYPEALATLAPDRLRALGEDYLAGTARHRRLGRRHFVDKQPANWVHAGLIRLILPHARIVDMRRDPFACCLSLFRQHFARGALFSYAIPALAREYAAYAETMAHWDEAMPGAVRRVTLEDLVADLEATVRALLDGLGLPFAPECLRFHETARAIDTPSAEQVRRPVNDDGAALARLFAPHAGALRDALAEAGVAWTAT